jgi:hypothetical protein
MEKLKPILEPFEEGVFIIKVETPTKGEIPADELRVILNVVEGAFARVLGYERRGPAKKVQVLVRIKEASTDVISRTVRSDGSPLPEGAEACKAIYGVLNSIKERPDITHLPDADYAVIKPFIDLTSKIGKKYPVKVTLEEKAPGLELDSAWVDAASAIFPIIPAQEKEVTVWGKLLEGDFREGKYTCKLILPNGTEKKCVYSPALEEDIAKHLQPLNRDVVVKGVEKKGGKKREALEIRRIYPQTGLFGLEDIVESDEDPNRFLGLLADVGLTADELTKRMIEDAWGGE